jgi:phosphoesterase RecJ-like protein
MELTPKQQAVDLIKKSKNILIITSEANRGDGVSSALALQLVLKKLEKESTFVKNNNLYNTISFLPGAEKIQKELSLSNDFVISLSLDKAKASKVRYEINNNNLQFFISSSEGKFLPENVSFSDGNSTFDLIIVLDCHDMESLGEVYDKNTDFFYKKPIINIDHHSSNDYFGAVNFVDLTASSTSEILVSLIDSLETGLIDEEVATCLLTGIIIDTNSFQNSKTTPKSLTTTAQLVALGAKHEEVIKNLFKTKPFDVLKVWGKILSEVETDKEHKILWSSISQEEFGNSDPDKEIVEGVLDELLSTVHSVNIYLLFLEKTDSVQVFIRTKKGLEAKKIAYLFGGEGRAERGFFTAKGENKAILKKEIIEKISAYSNQAGLTKTLDSDL